MARVTGPLMSFDASGSIAGAVVFSKWRGRNYVRRHAVPSNPRTTAQLAARSIIAFLGAQWASLAANIQATWLDGSEALKISPFNEYVRVNARNWRDQLAPSQATPTARDKTAGTNALGSPTVGGRQVSVPYTFSEGSDDWAICLCRSMVTGFTAGPSNVVQIVAVADSTDVFVDGPLEPGVYYYKSFVFAEDGSKGAAGTQVSATVV